LHQQQTPRRVGRTVAGSCKAAGMPTAWQLIAVLAGDS